jgi:hypothetical protein
LHPAKSLPPRVLRAGIIFCLYRDIDYCGYGDNGGRTPLWRGKTLLFRAALGIKSATSAAGQKLRIYEMGDLKVGFLK